MPKGWSKSVRSLVGAGNLRQLQWRHEASEVVASAMSGSGASRHSAMFASLPLLAQFQTDRCVAPLGPNRLTRDKSQNLPVRVASP
jgi:hypothetical protein